MSLAVPAAKLAQLVEIGQEAVVLAEAQDAHVGADALRDRVVLLVGRQHRHDPVAWLDQRQVRELIGSARAVRDQDVLARLIRVERGHVVA